MTKRPTTTTTLSANFQASNALPPSSPHAAFRAPSPDNPCSHAAIMPKRRKVPPHPGPRFLQRLRQSPDCPSRFLFLRRNRSSPSSLLPTRRSNYCRHHHCHCSAGTAQQSIRQQPLPVPAARTATTENDATSPIHREADAKCRRKKGGIGRKHTRFFVISRNFFEQVPVHDPMRPRQRPRSVRPTASLRAKTPSALTFFAFRFASLPIPPYLCAHTCPQNFAPSVVKWPWLGFFSSPCCRNWW